jgi:hypothetical protein
MQQAHAAFPWGETAPERVLRLTGVGNSVDRCAGQKPIDATVTGSYSPLHRVIPQQQSLVVCTAPRGGKQHVEMQDMRRAE